MNLNQRLVLATFSNSSLFLIVYDFYPSSLDAAINSSAKASAIVFIFLNTDSLTPLAKL